MNDPYPEPFEWSVEFIMPIIVGLIPHECEQGFYPLIDGSAIECPTCSK
jgi:hypothetical protein